MQIRRSKWLRGIILLLASVSAQALLAWGCALWSPTTDGTWRLASPTDIEWWNSRAPSHFTPNPKGALSQVGFGVSILFVAQNDQDSPSGFNVGRVQAGWPFRSFETVSWGDFLGQQMTLEGGFSLGPWYASIQNYVTHFVIPLRPLWLGFVANSLIIAAVLALVLLSFTAAVSHWRRIRQICQRCRYPVAGLDQCPECGLPIRDAATTTRRSA